MTSPIDELRRAHDLLGHAIHELRGIDAGRFTDAQLNGTKFGDADRFLIEADALLYKACTALGIAPLRISDTMSDGLAADGGPPAWQRARAIDHLNRIHRTRAQIVELVARQGGAAAAVGMSDDRALQPSALERKYLHRSALQAHTRFQLIAGGIALAAVTVICCIVGAIATVASNMP